MQGAHVKNSNLQLYHALVPRYCEICIFFDIYVFFMLQWVSVKVTMLEQGKSIPIPNDVR